MRLGVVETIWLGIPLVAQMFCLSVSVCVHLWFKAFHASSPKNPPFRTQKSAKTPAKTHIVNPRQP
jgi:hypothetical protein